MSGSHTLRLEGELSIVEAARQHAVLSACLADHAGDLTLELDALESCDSAGVQLLLATRRELQARGQRLHIASCSDAVRAALGTYGLAHDTLQPVTPGTGAS